MMPALRALLPAGFLTNSDVHTALVVGALVAVTAAVTGVFVVLRGQAFVGHVLGDIGSTGAAAAYLTGASELWGYLMGGAFGGLATEALGSGRRREGEVATGITLAFMLGLGDLLLYLGTQDTQASGNATAILFGSIFTTSPSVIPDLLALSAAVMILLGLLYRPLLLSTVTPEVARARGVPFRLVGLLFMLALIVAVDDASLAAGALLSTALLIGPSAAALLWTQRIGQAMMLAALVALAATWAGILLAYASNAWPPVGHGWPVSFFIAWIVLLVYLVARRFHPRRVIADRMEEV